jgi:hypothetical protein
MGGLHHEVLGADRGTQCHEAELGFDLAHLALAPFK